MNIQKLKLEELNPAPYNPRKKLQPGDPEFEKLKRSIETFGFVELIVVNKQTGNTVISGHQRLSVLKHLKWTEAECVIVDLDPESEKALNVAMNKVGGAFDIPLLTDLLKDLDDSGFDVSLTGFDAAELDELFDPGVKENVQEDDDFDLTPPEEPICKLGDIVLLGRHRLMVGDSTDQDNVSTLMDGSKAQMIFTDLPWNISYGEDKKHPSWKPRKILNDSMSPEQFKTFLHKAFSVMKGVIVPGGMLYSVMGIVSWSAMDIILKELGYHFSCSITWAKDTLVLSRRDYHTQTEFIWYGWEKSAPRICPLVDRKQSDLWSIPRPKRSDQHPMTKPVELVARAIMNSSHKDDLVIDFFGGSGSTLIAADMTDRRCNMMELDPHYASLIALRYIHHREGSDDVVVIRGDKKIPWDEMDLT